jgi:hypothetical protein
MHTDFIIHPNSTVEFTSLAHSKIFLEKFTRFLHYTLDFKPLTQFCREMDDFGLTLIFII